MKYKSRDVIFGFNLGEMRQVHTTSSTTSMAAAVGDYMGIFSNDIQEMITHSFESRLTEDQFFSTLALIEKFGKRRKTYRKKSRSTYSRISWSRRRGSKWRRYNKF